jgi:uracil-DNA glycosylase
MASTEYSADAIAALLRFYAEAGVDVAVLDRPVDRFASSRAEASQRGRRREAAHQLELERERVEAIADAKTSAPPPEIPRPAINLSVPSEAVIMAAREAAATAETLDELRATLAGFEGCNLRHTATNLVFGDGSPEAQVMFVGEAPGFEEDIQGLPFVGRSGKLLDRMIKAIGLDRTSAYIANVIPWRPPGNRDPTPQETEICRPFIERQITLVDPDFLILLGKASANQLLRTATPITRLRGQWRPYQTGRREIRAMATLHPAYLLRQPLQKRLAWRDLLMLKKAMAEGRSNEMAANQLP